MSEARTEEDIRRADKRSALTSLLGSIGAALLFFYSFVFGAWLGPGPLHPIEIAAGSTFSLLLGTFMSRPIVRRRMEMQARWVTELEVGKKRRRISFFGDHARVGNDIVLLSRIQETKLENGVLSVRYDRFGQPEPTVYALKGPGPSLERAQKHFERR
jgi:hypothetical protein